MSKWVKGCVGVGQAMLRQMGVQPSPFPGCEEPFQEGAFGAVTRRSDAEIRQHAQEHVGCGQHRQRVATHAKPVVEGVARGPGYTVRTPARPPEAVRSLYPCEKVRISEIGYDHAAGPGRGRPEVSTARKGLDQSGQILDRQKEVDVLVGTPDPVEEIERVAAGEGYADPMPAKVGEEGSQRRRATARPSITVSHGVARSAGLGVSSGNPSLSQPDPGALSGSPRCAGGAGAPMMRHLA